MNKPLRALGVIRPLLRRRLMAVEIKVAHLRGVLAVASLAKPLTWVGSRKPQDNPLRCRYFGARVWGSYGVRR